VLEIITHLWEKKMVESGIDRCREFL
jgi:hypothetical protein